MALHDWKLLGEKMSLITDVDESKGRKEGRLKNKSTDVSVQSKPCGNGNQPQNRYNGDDKFQGKGMSAQLNS